MMLFGVVARYRAFLFFGLLISVVWVLSRNKTGPVPMDLIYLMISVSLSAGILSGILITGSMRGNAIVIRELVLMVSVFTILDLIRGIERDGPVFIGTSAIFIAFYLGETVVWSITWIYRKTQG